MCKIIKKGPNTFYFSHGYGGIFEQMLAEVFEPFEWLASSDAYLGCVSTPGMKLRPLSIRVSVLQAIALVCHHDYSCLMGGAPRIPVSWLLAQSRSTLTHQ